MKPVKALLAPILLLTMLIAVSCTQPSTMKEPGVGHVRLTTTEEKGLEVLDAGGIDHYEYEAHPRFSLEEGFRLYGETDWKELGADTGSSEIIGPFTQGYWVFGLRALVPSGEVMWEGTGEGYISESSLSVIPVTMHRVPGEGEVLFEIDIPESTSSMPNPVVKFDETTASIAWTKTGAGTGTISYSGTISGVAAGWHSVSVRFTSGKVEAGDAMAVQVIPGVTVIIRGKFEVGEYEKPYLTIDSPSAARGEIRMSGGTTKVTTDTMEMGETHTYAYAITEGRTSVTTKWYVNGEEKGSGNSFAFTPEANGTYEIAALSRYYAESSLGGTWIEETTSASITVLVHPEMSTLTWNSGTVTTRQSLPYDTVLTVGAPSREGYEFSHWTVTGGMSGNVTAGTKINITKPAYNFTAVWNEKPAVRLELSSALRLTYASSTATTIPATGILGKLTSSSTTYTASKVAVRWFVDGKEVFWICDRGDGTYTIPGAEEAGLTPGKYPLAAQVDCGGTVTSCRMTVTWQ